MMFDIAFVFLNAGGDLTLSTSTNAAAVGAGDRMSCIFKAYRGVVGFGAGLSFTVSGGALVPPQLDAAARGIPLSFGAAALGSAAAPGTTPVLSGGWNDPNADAFSNSMVAGAKATSLRITTSGISAVGISQSPSMPVAGTPNVDWNAQFSGGFSLTCPPPPTATLTFATATVNLLASTTLTT